jgi:DNA-binding transcriptional ArsR family regulator
MAGIAPFCLSDAPDRSGLEARYFQALGDATQPKVSNHLAACPRWCGVVTTRREHGVVFYRLADQRVAVILDLVQGLLDDNTDHVAACCRIPEA